MVLKFNVFVVEWDVWMTHISSWVDFYRYWLDMFPGKTHVIYYNNLKRRQYAELLGAINFLGVPFNETRLNCTIKYPRHAYFKRPNVKSPVDKAKLFGLSMSKARKAITIFKDLIHKKFGKNSETYQNFNLDISVKELREDHRVH